MSGFDKIIGYEAQKEELKQICDILKNQQKYKEMGIRIPHGLLLYGHPGVGKTIMCKALIQESGLKSYQCGKTCADGELVEQIAKTFETAKENAPSIVFLDDADKLGPDERSGGDAWTAIQSGFESVKDSQVFVLATANNTRYFPESLLRAGRFDKQRQIEEPSTNEIEGIVKHYFANKSIDEDVDTKSIAYMLQHESCATLESIINEAGMLACYNGCKKIAQSHITNAILMEKFHCIPTGKSNIDEETLKTVAYHEAGHAVISLLLDNKSSGLLSVEKRDDRGGGVFKKYCDKKNANKIDDILILLGGKAAIEYKYHKSDIGCSSDLNDATGRLYDLMASIGYFNFDHLYVSYDMAEERKSAIEKGVISKIEECYKQALVMVTQHADLLEEIAQNLIEKRTLIPKELNEIRDAYFGKEAV